MPLQGQWCLVIAVQGWKSRLSAQHLLIDICGFSVLFYGINLLLCLNVFFMHVSPFLVSSYRDQSLLLDFCLNWLVFPVLSLGYMRQKENTVNSPQYCSLEFEVSSLSPSLVYTASFGCIPASFSIPTQVKRKPPTEWNSTLLLFQYSNGVYLTESLIPVAVAIAKLM